MATVNTPEKQICVAENLFNWPSDDPRLMATRCKSCGSCFFPRTFTCGNPGCKEKNIENILLSKRGKLWSWSTQFYKPPPPFIATEPYVPFAVGLLEFPEGIKILGIVTGCTDPDRELKIDMDMEVVADKLFMDENGNEVIGWKFKPIS